VVAVFLASIASCATGNRGGSHGATSAPFRADGLAIGDATTLYREAGLIAVAGPVSYVGTLGFFAAPTPDSTLSLLTLSLPTRALTFIREGDRYRAEYRVTADIRRDGSLVHHIEAKEIVRVVSYRETSRAEESVIFQEYFALVPGLYTLAIAVRDEASSRTGSYEREMTVPMVDRHGLSSSLPVHDALPRLGIDSLPRLVTSPRSTAVFGRDSTLSTYVEAYGLLPGEQIQAAIRGSDGMILWSDSVSLSSIGVVSSGLVRVPVSPLGIGALSLVLRRAGRRDSTLTPLFISFGDDLPVASFEDMLSYLIFFASPQRLSVLRNAALTERATIWAAFLRETDPIPETGQHEVLQSYFSRIQQANQDFREEGGVGWRTDRGRVFVALGAPDNILEPTGASVNQRNAVLVWEYQRLQLQLVFVDQTGFNRWRLNPNSELDFQAAVRREQIR
jgi:GWxTD domain-containing protein